MAVIMIAAPPVVFEFFFGTIAKSSGTCCRFSASSEFRNDGCVVARDHHIRKGQKRRHQRVIFIDS
jgi:hypothetical protein